MFMLYRAAKGSSEWRFVKSVSLAKLLVEQILAEARTKQQGAEGSMGWEISGRELCDRVVIDVGEREPTDEYRLVIDATYTREDAVLLEICHVWGYASPRWSPLVLRLSPVYDSSRPRGRKTPVEQFEAEDECGRAVDFVHEILYLQHGHQEGKKNWGRTGFTNAALLYPPDLEHLLNKIGFKLAG
jgi:hypothetical protein